MGEERQFMVLSALGPDKPGLVAEVTRFLSDHGANVEDSRMAVLGGEFGILLLFSAAGEEHLRAVVEEAKLLEKTTGLTVMFRPTVSPEEHRKAAAVPCRITASALDQEGIVRAISQALYRAGVNIVSMQTHAYHAPVTGSPLFGLEASVDVPQGVSVTGMRQALEEVAVRHGFDVEVHVTSAG